MIRIFICSATNNDVFFCLCYDISSLLVIRAMVWFPFLFLSFPLPFLLFYTLFSLSFRNRFRVNIIIVGKLGCVLLCFLFPALRLTIGNILLIYGMALLTFRTFCLFVLNSARFFVYFVGGSFSWISPFFFPSISIFLVC